MTKKESIASMANADALTITPETSAGTAPTSSIRNSGENVKKYSADQSKKLARNECPTDRALKALRKYLIKIWFKKVY